MREVLSRIISWQYLLFKMAINILYGYIQYFSSRSYSGLWSTSNLNDPLLKKSGEKYLSSAVLAKYSLSMRPSIRFLITWGLGKNLSFNCSTTYGKNQDDFEHQIVNITDEEVHRIIARENLLPLLTDCAVSFCELSLFLQWPLRFWGNVKDNPRWIKRSISKY